MEFGFKKKIGSVEKSVILTFDVRIIFHFQVLSFASVHV